MYHIVAVWDKANTTARLYVDGVYQSEVTTNPDYFVKASSIDGYYWNAIGCGTINTGSFKDTCIDSHYTSHKKDCCVTIPHKEVHQSNKSSCPTC